MEELELLAVPIEIRIGLANQILNGRAISIRHRLIHQREASLTVFGKNKVRINVYNLPEECSLLLQRLFRSFVLADVDGSTDIPEKCAIGRKAWHSMIEDPAILTVESPQAVFHRKLLPRVEGVCVDFKTAVEVVGMDALRPPIAKLLLHRTAGKGEPAFVEKDTELIRARHPDHHGRCVGHGAKASFALPQRVVGSLTLRDVNGHATQPKRPAVPVKLDPPARRNPTYRAVAQHDTIFGDIIAATSQRLEHSVARRLAVVRMQRTDEPFEVNWLGFGPAKQPATLWRDPGFVTLSVPHPQTKAGCVGSQAYAFLALSERLLSLLALANIKHEAAKFDRLSIPMLALDDVVHPDSLPRRTDHAIFEL